MIFLTSRNLLKRDLERFGLKVWNKFYVLDISKFSKRDKLRKIDHKKTIKISSLRDLMKFLKKSKQEYLIDNTENNIREIIVKLILKIYRIKIIKYFGGLKPENSNFKKKFDLNLIIRRYLLSLIYKYIFDIVLITGEKHENFSIYLKGKKEIFYTHSFDYNHFLELKKSNRKKNFILYLDQNFISHPIFEINKTKPKADKNFYKRLEVFFKKVEKKNKCKIKIALHPSSKKNNLHFSNKFKCYSNKTAELVRDSKFIIAHYSTAISLAVLFEKPITFISSSDMLLKRADYLTKDFSYKLGSKFMNIESEKNFFLNKRINKKKYQKFVNEYVKHPKSQNINTWKYLKKKLKIYNL